MIGRWREQFARDPERAVADLFSGRAGVGSGLRLDVPDLLYQAFPEQPELAADRRRLDDALLAWLTTMRRDYARQVQRLGFAVYGKRLCDALLALQLLNLPSTRYQIRQTRDAWLRWLTPLRLGSDRDPALECWRLLTRDQPDSADTATWLHLAADPRPEYLNTALVGLRNLPNEHDARRNQVLMLNALLRHAQVTYPDAQAGRAFVNRELAALRGRGGDYPRSPQHWQSVLSEALDGFAGPGAERRARDLADALRKPLNQARTGGRQRGAGVQPAAKQDRELLEHDIKAALLPAEQLAERLFRLLEQNRVYAVQTGDSYFFVRTLHNLGGRLLQQEKIPADRLDHFGTLVEQALTWEPLNPYCWMLWADWFIAVGRQDPREWVLREMARLFPDDAHTRVELARLLIRRGEPHWDEAERWLRQVADRDPTNAPSRIVLAALLERRGQRDLAIELLAGFVSRYPENAAAQQLLEKLQGEVAANMDFDPYMDAGEPAEDAQLEHREPKSVSDTAVQGVPMHTQSRAIDEIKRRALLSAELTDARLATQGDGPDLFERIAEIRAQAEQGDALAGLYRQWLEPDTVLEPPPYAWAWRTCRLWQTAAHADAWAQMEQEFPQTAMESGFLHLLATRDEAQLIRWRARFGEAEVGSAHPAAKTMRRTMDRLDNLTDDDRNEVALAVMASAALDVPDFATHA